MKKVTIALSDDEVKTLEKRAKKNLLSLQEQVEDIVRRSCVSYKQGTYSTIKVDDKLVEIFSRQKRGRKRKNNGHCVK